MGNLAAALGTEAQSETISFKGKRMEIRPLSVEVLDKFENSFIERARRAKIATWADLVNAGVMTREEAQAKAEKFTDDCVEGGTYAFGSQAMNRALFDQDAMPTEEEMQVKQRTAEQNPALEAERLNNLPTHVKLNKLKLFALMMDVTVDDLKELLEDEQKRVEFMAKMAKVWKQSLPDPKATGAAAA